MSSTVSRPPQLAAGFPKPPLAFAAALIVFVIAAAALGRLSGAGNPVVNENPISRRILRFEDRADGAVLVFDAAANPTDTGATPLAVETGQNGFLRGTLRGFARTRHLDQVNSAAPFVLTAWADGRLTLNDPATGRHADLEAFGPANVPVFANLLPRPTIKPDYLP
jgi:putative photosynthetic complex assembly protein